MKTAESRAPYLKSARNTTVKNFYTCFDSTVEDDVLTEFYEKKRFIEQEFQDIEDRIVGFYLKTKPLSCSTTSIREQIQKQMIPLYKMVMDPIQVSVHDAMVQLKKAPSDAEIISKINRCVGDGGPADDVSNSIK